MVENCKPSNWQAAHPCPVDPATSVQCWAQVAVWSAELEYSSCTLQLCLPYHVHIHLRHVENIHSATMSMSISALSTDNLSPNGHWTLLCIHIILVDHWRVDPSGYSMH